MADDPAGDLGDVEPGKIGVQERHVGAELLRDRHGVVAVAGLSHDRDVLLALEERAEAGAQDGMAVGDDDTDAT
jgi:hypothetical protein